MKDTFNNLTFVRWGNLNPVKHKEIRLLEDEKYFHTAPCLKGIYAFPKGHIERFLLGVSNINSFNSNNVRIKPLKYNGKLITLDDFYESDGETIKKQYKPLLKKLQIHKKNIEHICIENSNILDSEGNPIFNWYIFYQINKHEFIYHGYLWHHFGNECDEKDIVNQKGSWVKTSYDVYLKAFRRTFYKDRFNVFLCQKRNKIDISGCSAGIFGGICKDAYEVFIERIR